MPGRGYKFVGQMQRAAGPAAASPPPISAMTADALTAALGGSHPGQTYTFTAGDFNGDGKLDLAVVNPLDGSISILLNATEPGVGGVSFAPAVKLDQAEERKDGAPQAPGLRRAAP